MTIDYIGIFDLISRACQAWPEKIESISEGSWEDLPQPKDFDNYAAGKKFAFIDIMEIVPEYIGDKNIYMPTWNYEISIIHKLDFGANVDITKLRHNLINFVSYWNEYWQKEGFQFIISNTITGILPKLKPVEETYDAIAVLIRGNIKQIREISGRNK